MTAPSKARTLVASLDGWSVIERPGSGTADFGGLSEGTDGEGRRSRVVRVLPVESYLVRARHADGRAFVAIWLHRVGDVTARGAKRWSLDTCWRGRHADEHTPSQLSDGELKAYVAGGREAVAALAIEQHKKAAARAAKKAAARAAEKASTT